MEPLEEFYFSGSLDHYEVSQTSASLRLYRYIVGYKVPDHPILELNIRLPQFTEQNLAALKDCEIDYVSLYKDRVEFWVFGRYEPFAFSGDCVKGEWKDFEIADYKRLLEIQERSWEQVHKDLIQAQRTIDETLKFVRELQHRAELKSQRSSTSERLYSKEIEALRRVERKLRED